MTTPSNAPADTRMMTIVHQAMRRDLHRAQSTLGATPPPSRAQIDAVAEHLTWMTGFIRAHHHSEDEGLYPLVRERDSAAAGLLDAMHADHQAVAAALDDVDSAAATNRTAELAAAVERLSSVLLPHLDREEAEMMPVVSSVITRAEWQAVEQRYNLDSKSFVELGREGHWLIDEASPADRAAVLELVHPVSRFVLLHGFARSYRRRKEACWGTPARTKRRVQMAGGCRVDVDADVDAVWDVVRDVTRVGEWSHECVDVQWLDRASSATPGARFRGRNRAGLFRWGRVCEIVSAEPYELVWRTLSTVFFPDSTEWRIKLRRTGEGTQIEQRFEGRCPAVLAYVYVLMIPGHRDRTAALEQDLRRLGEVAAAAPAKQPLTA